jgi:hypothetical protein
MFHSSASFPCPEMAPSRLAASRVVTEKGQQQSQEGPLSVGLLQHKLNKVRRRVWCEMHSSCLTGLWCDGDDGWCWC